MKKGGKVKKYGIGGDIRDAWRRFTNPSPQERQAAERQFQDQVNARFAPGYNPANDPSAVRYYGLTPGFTGGSGSAGGASGPVAPPSGPSGPLARRGKRAGGKISSGYRSSADGVASKGKTRGTEVRMASGGSVGGASKRADGIAQRGKTKGRMC